MTTDKQTNDGDDDGQWLRLVSIAFGVTLSDASINVTDFGRQKRRGKFCRRIRDKSAFADCRFDTGSTRLILGQSGLALPPADLRILHRSG
jgi:hypothetical protein